MTHSLSTDLPQGLALEIVNPARTYTLAELRGGPTLVPDEPGVYGWWFDKFPPRVPKENVLQLNGLYLLYVGIAPSTPTSKRTLRDRLRNHFRGPIATSTLRRSLAVLLDPELELDVRRHLSGKLVIGAEAETKLTEWISTHARVCWVVTLEPWLLETYLISAGLPLPLNIKGSQNPFSVELRRMRAARACLPSEY
jgi:GIY-YIG catalytic domain